MTVTLEVGPWFTFVLRAETGETRLIQHDGDFIGVARSFGWVGEECDRMTAASSAVEFLRLHVGETIEDPGYIS